MCALAVKYLPSWQKVENGRGVIRVIRTGRRVAVMSKRECVRSERVTYQHHITIDKQDSRALTFEAVTGSAAIWPVRGSSLLSFRPSLRPYIVHLPHCSLSLYLSLGHSRRNHEHARYSTLFAPQEANPYWGYGKCCQCEDTHHCEDSSRGKDIGGAAGNNNRARNQCLIGHPSYLLSSCWLLVHEHA